MTITVGLAINDRIYIIGRHPIKSAKPPLLWRLKKKMNDMINDIASSFMASMMKNGVA